MRLNSSIESNTIEIQDVGLQIFKHLSQDTKQIKSPPAASPETASWCSIHSSFLCRQLPHADLAVLVHGEHLTANFTLQFKVFSSHTSTNCS
ncbi:hypothetical protein RHMOL_Rhmol06G0221300 [Rhododendron molle]|uniref:Uncharacterized protein n=1 Tax=Rhododendron molle TaxID=49168 RepID=A0ACC0NF31_RHOML|nr:hypothetical protein RHMOL_Rhmol06G0221300 [Rhododendron molle]